MFAVSAKTSVNGIVDIKFLVWRGCQNPVIFLTQAFVKIFCFFAAFHGQKVALVAGKCRHKIVGILHKRRHFFGKLFRCKAVCAFNRPAYPYVVLDRINAGAWRRVRMPFVIDVVASDVKLIAAADQTGI